jgi:hypothetical protein
LLLSKKEKKRKKPISFPLSFSQPFLTFFLLFVAVLISIWVLVSLLLLVPFKVCNFYFDTKKKKTMKGESKDPAFKLFGRKIPVPDTQFPAEPLAKVLTYRDMCMYIMKYPFWFLVFGFELGL